MTAPTLDIAGAIAVLTDVGVLPVITLGALMYIGARLYKAFRR